MPPCDVIHPRELDAADVRAWSALQLAIPALAHPLLGPQFAQAVGAVRDDARIAVWRDGSQPVGFLPHHRRPSGFARPIGGPFSDYHALICASGIELEGGEALRAAGLRALRVHGLIDPENLFSQSLQGQVLAHRITLSGDAAEHLERLHAQSRNGAKNHKRNTRKLAGELGELRLAAPETDQAAFERMLVWKSAQLRGSGLHDFLGVSWMRALLQGLFETQGGDFEGLMISLYAGETHVAGQFGVRLGDWFHPWIAASHPDYRGYSPGILHQWDAIAAMPRLGLRIYDLGLGGEHWKRMFAPDPVRVRSGLLTAASPSGRLSAAQERVWTLPGLERLEAVGRLRRRFDQIAAMELTLGGRVRGVMTALAGYERRNAGRRQSAAV